MESRQQKLKRLSGLGALQATQRSALNAVIGRSRFGGK